MIDQLVDEAEWLLTYMHRSKAIKGQGSSVNLMDNIYHMAYGPAHTCKLHEGRKGVRLTDSTRSVMFYTEAEHRMLWLLYELNPGKLVTNVQCLYSEGKPTTEDEFWWMTMFVSYRNVQMRLPVMETEQ